MLDNYYIETDMEQNSTVDTGPIDQLEGNSLIVQALNVQVFVCVCVCVCGGGKHACHHY